MFKSVENDFTQPPEDPKLYAAYLALEQLETLKASVKTEEKGSAAKEIGQRYGGYLDMAWEALSEFQTTADNTQAIEQFATLANIATQHAIALSNLYLAKAEDILELAHEEETYYPDAIDALENDRLKYNAMGMADNSEEMEEAEREGYVPPGSVSITNGFNTSRPVSKTQDIFDLFSNNLIRYRDASDFLHMANSIYLDKGGPGGRNGELDRSIGYQRMRKVTRQLDALASGESKAAEELNAQIHDQALHIRNTIHTHLTKANGYKDYYQWAMSTSGSELCSTTCKHRPDTLVQGDPEWYLDGAMHAIKQAMYHRADQEETSLAQIRADERNRG